MYEIEFARMDRDRIGEIRAEFHWLEFCFGIVIGMAALEVLLITL